MLKVTRFKKKKGIYTYLAYIIPSPASRHTKIGQLTFIYHMCIKSLDKKKLLNNKWINN